ncbi:hypothetical protein CDAR_15731 [Caerostris darwini]|uniref:Uncharacterized protein n=1 Tax=Caerostris darwini TaxID=1538125 RepID=A0AAV4N876_9ARAC|nr:hypothetical protein CDAR_15731 [Caerostris darwini]
MRQIGFDSAKLKNKNIKRTNSSSKSKKFDTPDCEKVEMECDTQNIEHLWQRIRKTITDTVGEVIGKNGRQANKEWITDKTWKQIEKKKIIKHMLESIKSTRNHKHYKEKYREADRNVKKTCC